jgi:hypothetical protein
MDQQDFFDSPAVRELSEILQQKAQTPDSERPLQHCYEGIIIRPLPGYYQRGLLRELVEGGAQ